MDCQQVCTKQNTIATLILCSVIIVVIYTGKMFYMEPYSLSMRAMSDLKTVSINTRQDHGKPVGQQFPHKTSWMVNSPISIKNVTLNGYTVMYEKYIYIPKPPPGTKWPEEDFLDDIPLATLEDTVFPSKSVVKLIGHSDVKLGEKIKLKIELFDGKGRKRKGGDLVRVWMKESTLQAASVADVTDNQDGSYDATFQTFWAGRPQIRMAVISPREVIATQFKRRYIFPPPLLNTAEFGDPTRTEVTPCGVLPQIPGYTDICNLTNQNYGQPWYCGKPRTRRCEDWSLVSDISLWDKRFESKLFTPIELQLLSRNYQAMIIPNNITVSIKPDIEGRIAWSDSKRKCNTEDRTHTWLSRPPSGFLYKKSWIILSCKGRDRHQSLEPCIKNMTIVLIGDSTVRQIYSSLVDMIPCTWGTERITQQNKHKTFKCEVKPLRYSVEYHNHEQPFCTTKAGKQFFKSVEAYLEPFKYLKDTKVVVLLHIFSHFINHHSFVFYQALLRIKSAIVQFLESNPHAYVIVKGPHSYAFELKNGHKFIQKPERYMETYMDYIYKEFSDVRQRVIFMDAADITVATEQNFIHPEENVVQELIHQMFDFVCSY